MSIARLVRTVLSIALVLTLVPRAFATPPTVFANKPLEDARTAAAASGKLLLVDFTASWCGPCKRMDRTTWVDPDVVKWVGEHAIAVQIDVDKEPEVSKSLSVEAMPTMVVFRGKEVFDRVVGYQSPSELLGWLKGVTEGRRRVDAARAAADRKDGDGKIDIDAKYELASELARAGRLDEATEAYVWLWDHMLEHQPSMYGVRLSFMRSEMQDLARRHPAARERFTAMRDAVRKRLDADLNDSEAPVDWFALCAVVGDQKSVIAWFDAVRNDDARSGQVDRIADDLAELLVGAGRWADAGRVFEDPVASARQTLDMIAMEARVGADAPAEERKAMAESMVRFAVEGNARLHACCLAAARDAAAGKIAAATFKAVDTGSARVEFVRMALKARAVRGEMRAWLDQAAAKGEDVTLLRERLDALLAQVAETAPGGPPEPAR